MGKDAKISRYRERLDKTLASPELTNPDAIKTLARNQLLRSSLHEAEGCSENVIEAKSNQVSDFLDMLRSASVTDNHEAKNSTPEAPHVGWKLKEDNEEFRVMYRPGPEGTPLHTILVEGYVNAPVHICLSVSWESILYPKWWPHYTFPPFKLTISKCLQKIQTGEHISLMRVKITWPLTAREAVVHYSLFEFLQDELIVVLLNTISDSEYIDKSTHGFIRDDIPKAWDVVRIDAVGGFAIQKVTPERSYIRTIGNVDLKLDFVPSSLINFIARQIIGNGFRLYQKAASSVSIYDEDYCQVLKDPMYARIQEALYPMDTTSEMIARKELKSDGYFPSQELLTGMVETNSVDMDENVHGDDSRIESLPANAQISDESPVCKVDGETSRETNNFRDEIRGAEEEVHSINHPNEDMQHHESATEWKTYGEIEEDTTDDSKHLEISGNDIVQISTNKIVQKNPEDRKRNIHIRPEVQNALETLETAISMVREFGFGQTLRYLNSSTKEEEIQHPGRSDDKTSDALQVHGVCSENVVSDEISGEERTVETTSHQSRDITSHHDIRHPGSKSFSREGNHSRVMPAPPEQLLQSIPTQSNHGEQEMAMININTQEDTKKTNTDMNGIYQNSRRKKSRLCCFPGF